ncbi:peptidase domain-containing ABC transporter [Duganella sp. BJB488]|uniref:peptidase domain-containing ABC transporter n=1 Tax=unclassified Duganella TaxID=2636909 RepID=UPI000E357BE9|nr:MULTISPECIES: peptidase domain-containing ABC transporter [unclassified Duganella]RFP10448.1 peptidase domain-containing ABC transporter [Duganella sp. BJB489]RFP14293.1 peptidase domain-containing ABC transporter [Duganella sp. BJB488]RFP30229.1 peptidase domain-containing ABC transporter [Duganella sp. BJB480]
MNFLSVPHLHFWQRRRLPLLLQSEAAECGLACLAMVASYWGHKTDISSMRRRFSVSLKGASLRGLMSMAEGLALQARPLKLDLHNLADLKLPCILHWDLIHFVVLKSVAGRHTVILDPAVGERRLSLTEFAKHFTGIALELSPASTFEKKVEVQTFSMRSLMGRVVGLKRSLLQILALGLVLQLCSLIAPFYMQWVVDEALLSYDQDLVTVLGCGFLLLVLLQASITAVRSWATTVMSTDLNMQWLSNTFAHLLKLPLPYFEKRHTGDIVSRFNSVQSIQHSLTTQFVEGTIDGILVLGTFVMMLLYSTTLTAAAAVAVVIYILLRLIMFRPLRDATAEQIIHAAKQQTHFMESVRGIQSIRLFSAMGERRSSWINTLADQFNAELRVAKLSVTYQTANFLLFNIERVVVIWLAAIAVMDNRFSVGMLFAFISYKDQFSQRITSLIDKLFELRMLRLHGERVADIVLTEAEADTHHVEINLQTVSPSIELKNLSFRYADAEPLIFHNLNLSIPAGECIAITGPSGCGKTTLMKLLLGLLEPTSGDVLIGGINLRQLGLSNYRQMLGTVMQDDTLFSGSLNDNICFFTAAPDLARIEYCAKMAAVHMEISQMPMGFNTLIGDIGSGLSGGQRQRILLARALYRDPKILVLDEATSHLDVWNEQLVNAAIKEIPLTRVIVAHRPETIAMARRVVVLQQGTIVQDILQPGHPQAA